MCFNQHLNMVGSKPIVRIQKPYCIISEPYRMISTN